MENIMQIANNIAQQLRYPDTWSYAEMADVAKRYGLNEIEPIFRAANLHIFCIY